MCVGKFTERSKDQPRCFEVVKVLDVIFFLADLYEGFDEIFRRGPD